MSLKSKIEAVIYASEEPVTLAQLMGLLGQEAQAELDEHDSAQQTLALEEAEVFSEDGDAAAVEENLDIENLDIDTSSKAETPDVNVKEDPPPIPEDEADTADSSPVAEAEPHTAETDEQRTTRESKEEKDKARRLREYFRLLLDQLIADYGNGDRGLEIREVASGYRMGTKPEYHDAVRGFVKSLKPPLKLSLQALETLAVVAYKQPVTAPEVAEIRGVDSGGVLGSLMTRKLVTTAGRKQVIGRPILYKTTKDFLLRFGLKDISELPSIEEFEKMAGELAEQEEIEMEGHDHRAIPGGEQSLDQSAEEESAGGMKADPGEAPSEHHAPETPAELEPERHTHLPQADGSPDPVDDPLDDQLPDDEVEDEQMAETVEAGSGQKTREHGRD